MAFSDPSMNVVDFVLERVPEANPEALDMEASELVFNDSLFSRYALRRGLANAKQLRTAQQMQYRLFKTSGGQLNLAEVLVMNGVIDRKSIELLQANFPFANPGDPPSV
jgi:ubiquinone/menaquinone biosynthesis C-methylase UbiE